MSVLPENIHSLIEDFIEQNGGENEFDLNTIFEDLLSDFHNKLDLNNVSESDLKKLWFLNDIEINNILIYRDVVGQYDNLYELQAVPGLSLEKIQLILPFLRADGDTKFVNRLSSHKESSHIIYLKWKRQLETAKGYKSKSPSATPPFSGDPNSIYLRYKYSDNRIRAGFTMEKDPGEAITSSFRNPGFDFLSLHLQLDNVSKVIKQINLGDYSLSLGQGLILQNSFSLGKTAFTTSVKKRGQVLRHYSSINEARFFRGGAMNLQAGKSLNATLFASVNNIDGNLTGANPVLGKEVFSSFQESGLHRTEAEQMDRHAIKSLAIGGQVSYSFGKGNHIAMHTVYQNFDKTLKRRTQPYNQFRFEGDKLLGLGSDYAFQLGTFHFFGEMAVSDNGGLATLNGLLSSLDPSFDLAVVYRNYSKEYQSLQSNGFGETSGTNNEKGIYLGIDYHPNARWQFRAYSDFWNHEWLRFRTDAPSSGVEHMLRIDFREKEKLHYYFQYKYERKAQNAVNNSTTDYIVDRILQRLRLQINHTITDRIQFRNRIEMSFFSKETENKLGFLAYQDIFYKSSSSTLQFNTRFSYFNIDSFNARIYTYENDLQYEYFIPSYYGHGFRYYGNIRWQFDSHFMAEFRLGQSQFLNRDRIGTGLSEIQGHAQTTIKIQLRIRV